jgi:hypothetical protein
MTEQDVEGPLVKFRNPALVIASSSSSGDATRAWTTIHAMQMAL